MTMVVIKKHDTGEVLVFPECTGFHQLPEWDVADDVCSYSGFGELVWYCPPKRAITFPHRPSRI